MPTEDFHDPGSSRTLLRGRDRGETSEAGSWCEKSPQSNEMSSQKSAKRLGERDSQHYVTHADVKLYALQ